MNEITREAIIQAAQRAAEEAGCLTLSRADFERRTGISQYHIYSNFPEGGWVEAKRLAGLERHPHSKAPLPDDKLMFEFHKVATELGRIPTWAQFSSRSSVSGDTVRRRFGGIQGVLKRYGIWLTAHDPDSPLLKDIAARSRHEIPAPPSSVLETRPPVAASRWQRTDGPTFGQPISFRGLRHAPVNEQGVVFLFGVVSYELGFIVEAVQASYPDCEAKRCVDQRRQRWQRVRIEFEFRSSNFRDHAHDPIGCDLIVCWEHDWPECPLEVVELCSAIDHLGGEACSH